MGKLTDDILKWTLDVNGDPARKELTEVSNSTNKLERDNRALATEMAKLEAHGKKGSEEWKKYEAQIAANGATIMGNKAKMEQLRKEVGLNNLSATELRKEMKSLKSQMDKMDPSSKGWDEMNDQFTAMKSRLSDINSGGSKADDMFGKFTETAKGLLPAFGFAALASGAVFAFGKIKDSTDDLSKAWDSMVNGLNEGMNELWRTIATGDWSNFSDRIKEAIELGEEYVNTIDDIEDKTRSISVREAESKKTEMELEIKLRNRLLSKDERIQAGKERIALEEGLTADRIKLAQEVFDNEAKLTAFQTKLSKEQLLNIARDLDSESKMRANAYNEQIDRYEKLKKANVTTVGGSNVSTGTLVAREDTPEMVRLKATIDATKEADKVYADQLRATGRTTDEQLDKMIDAYVRLQEAGVSGKENVKKIITQVNSLLAGIDEGGNKIENEGEKRAKALADFIGKSALEQQDAINKYFHEAGDGAWESFVDAIEKGQKGGIDFSVIPEMSEEKDVTDPTLEYASKKLEDSPDFLALQYKAGIIGKQQYEDKLTEITKTAEESRYKVKEQKMKQAQELVNLGANFVSAMMDYELEKAGDNEEKKAAIRKKYANIQFLTTASQIVIDTSAAIMKALAELGPIAGPIAAGIIGATGVVQLGIANKEREKMMGSKKDGGFSNYGDDNEPDGIYHKNEFIASAPAVRNPTVKPVLDIIDMAQKSGTIRSLNLSAILNTGRQGGGYGSGTSGSSPIPVNSPAGDGGLIIELLLKELKRSNDVMSKLEEKEFSISVETYERTRKSWEKVTNGGLS